MPQHSYSDDDDDDDDDLEENRDSNISAVSELSLDGDDEQKDDVLDLSDLPQFAVNDGRGRQSEADLTTRDSNESE